MSSFQRDVLQLPPYLGLIPVGSVALQRDGHTSSTHSSLASLLFEWLMDGIM